MRSALAGSAATWRNARLRRLAAYLQLDGISKAYGAGAGAMHALADITLEVQEGEFLAVVGPSGCGKCGTVARRPA